eukprot:8016954-Pyramimonas_sp.AAC.1
MELERVRLVRTPGVRANPGDGCPGSRRPRSHGWKRRDGGGSEGARKGPGRRVLVCLGWARPDTLLLSGAPWRLERKSRCRVRAHVTALRIHLQDLDLAAQESGRHSSAILRSAASASTSPLIVTTTSSRWERNLRGLRMCIIRLGFSGVCATWRPLGWALSLSTTTKTLLPSLGGSGACPTSFVGLRSPTLRD